jgi:hypothetical protein
LATLMSVDCLAAWLTYLLTQPGTTRFSYEQTEWRPPDHLACPPGARRREHFNTDKKLPDDLQT